MVVTPGASAGATEPARPSADEVLRAATEHAAEGFLVVALDGTIRSANLAVCRMTGYAVDELVGSSVLLLDLVGDVAGFGRAREHLAAGVSSEWRRRREFLRNDGSSFWADARAYPVRTSDGSAVALAGHIVPVGDESPRPAVGDTSESVESRPTNAPLVGYLSMDAREIIQEVNADFCGLRGLHGSMIDVSETMDQQQQRNLAEGLLIEATERAPIGQALVTLDGRFAQLNAAFCEITGYDRDDLLRLTFQTITHPDDLEKDAAQAAAVADGSIGSYEMEKRYIRRDGSLIWVKLYVSAIYSNQGEPLAFVSQVIDISRQKDAEVATTRAYADLSFRSVHDALTGLPNRDAIHEALAAALSSPSIDSQIAVMFIDVDRFKSVNDGISHTSGDQVLMEIAQRLRACLRPGDMAGRFGGDEFVVVSRRSVSDVSFTETAERIRSAISDSEILLELERGIHVSVSIGISIRRPGVTPAEMLSEADAAMYEAKNQGRDCWVVADDHMRMQVQDNVRLARLIRGGIARREFEPWFQPIVEFSTDRVIGFEALARWVSADRTMTAAEFIDVAEDSGSIKEVGRLIIARTIELMGGMGGDHFVAVNASPTEIADPGFSQMVSGSLQRHGVAPQCLAIEITEHALMNLGTDAHRGLLALSDSGVGLIVDDFGTGYSSISTLLQYPVTGIKLDLSFTAPVVNEPQGQAAQIVGGLADLADRLSLARIAEGIETEQQSRVLQELGWTFGQGWLYGRPAPASNWVPRPREEADVSSVPSDTSASA